MKLPSHLLQFCHGQLLETLAQSPTNQNWFVNWSIFDLKCKITIIRKY